MDEVKTLSTLELQQSAGELATLPVLVALYAVITHRWHGPSKGRHLGPAS
jgi:hypothetical protein